MPSAKPTHWHGTCIIEAMKQMSLDSTGFERKTKRTRKREFLDEMSLVVPWSELVSLITPHAPTRSAKGGRPPFPVETMLRIHFIQQWFNLSDPAMEQALYDTPMFREFAGLDMGEEHLPDESTILRFRHMLEAHNLSLQILGTVNAILSAKGLLLKQGTVVDATLIAAPSSTKNSTGTRDPEMHQTKKGNQWHHGMKALQGLPAKSMVMAC
jgi:IS5 family transposase